MTRTEKRNFKKSRKPSGIPLQKGMGRRFHLAHGSSNYRDKSQYPDWVNTKNINGAANIEEIINRVDIVKRSLINSILETTESKVSGNEIINHINVLIQQPTIILIYKKSEGAFRYLPHFDLEKTRVSRGSLELISNKNKTNNKFNPNIIPKNIESSLFRIMNTNYYFRVFLLDASGDDQPFYEITKNLHQNKSISFEYARICLNGLLSFHEEDYKHYSNQFLNEISKKISTILENYKYNIVKNRRAYTLTSAQDKNEANNLVQSLNQQSLEKYLKIDRIYNELGYAASTLKLLGANSLVDQSPKNFPNVFFALRTYNRDTPRAEMVFEKKFDGYAHNVFFAIPHTQRKNIEEYLEWLGKIGKEGYILHQSIGNEIYGGGRNPSEYIWKFGDNNSWHESFAESLDDAFWNLLRKEIGIKMLIEILSSPVSDDSISMFDAVFYYGSSIYRMPFRRNGGLSRFKKLDDIFKSLGHIKYSDTKKHKPLRNDCLRLVLFFYLTRMFAPVQLNQYKYYTKIHLYPIEIGGAIVGSIGKVSFQEKPNKDQEDFCLPTDTSTWNQEFLFFSKIVSTARLAIQQQYRDFQIEAIADGFQKYLTKLMDEANANGGILNDNISTRFTKSLNKTSRIISRVCPFSEFSFSLSNTEPHKTDDVGVIKFCDDIYFTIKKSKSDPIFRTLTSSGKDLIFIENLNSLMAKLREQAIITFDRYRYLQNWNGADYYEGANATRSMI